jgi:hypothetical protein
MHSCGDNYRDVISPSADVQSLTSRSDMNNRYACKGNLISDVGQGVLYFIRVRNFCHLYYAYPENFKAYEAAPVR